MTEREKKSKYYQWDMKHQAMAGNSRKEHPQPCQGWGRGFESLRPLQISPRSPEGLSKAGGRHACKAARLLCRAARFRSVRVVSCSVRPACIGGVRSNDHG